MEDKNEHNLIDRKPLNRQKKSYLPIWLRAIVILLVFILLASFVALVQQSNNVADMQATITFMESQNQAIQTQYETLEEENRNLQEIIATQEAENQNLQDNIMSLESQIDNLRTTPEP